MMMKHTRHSSTALTCNLLWLLTFLWKFFFCKWAERLVVVQH